MTTTLAGNRADCVLIGCVAEKAPLELGQSLPLRELYRSDLWAKRLAYAEAFEQAGGLVLVVSAFHGIRRLDYPSGAYDRKLSDQGAMSDRLDWGKRHGAGFRNFFGDQVDDRRLTVEIHAGADYRDVLFGPLHQQGIDLINPLEGLRGIGDQKRWYLDRAAAARQLALFEVAA